MFTFAWFYEKVSGRSSTTVGSLLGHNRPQQAIIQMITPELRMPETLMKMDAREHGGT